MRRRAFSSRWRRIISQASAPSGGQSRGPAVVALPRRAQEAGLPAASLRPRSAPPLSWSLGATSSWSLPPQPTSIRESKAALVLGASHVVTVLRSHGTGTRGSPRQTLPGRLTPQSLARGSVHSGWARGRGWGMLGPFLKPRSMNSR